MYILECWSLHFCLEAIARLSSAGLVDLAVSGQLGRVRRLLHLVRVIRGCDTLAGALSLLLLLRVDLEQLVAQSLGVLSN